MQYNLLKIHFGKLNSMLVQLIFLQNPFARMQLPPAIMHFNIKKSQKINETFFIYSTNKSNALHFPYFLFQIHTIAMNKFHPLPTQLSLSSVFFHSFGSIICSNSLTLLFIHQIYDFLGMQISFVSCATVYRVYFGHSIKC